ncbi:hypothetical protein [Rhodocyclus tenuis]|uniref:Putative membrane protein n=1 Tax=Rhodocyclus tenuis TaxID=1066 RepID=A0A840G6W8_RHOTE|nr:hypothetical protein [Rhodocyclus tenuis]MBB4247616.1 putative membrane protein [Rhodocyclus tenuis]
MEPNPSPSVTQQANSIVLAFAVGTVCAVAVGWLWLNWMLPALLVSAFVILGGGRFLPKTPLWSMINSGIFFGTSVGVVVALPINLLYGNH